MISLTLRYGDTTLKAYQFKDEKTISIGRNEDNDIIVKDNTVSGYHAKIELEDNRLLIKDLGSKNGIFINDKFVISHWLKNGDVIIVGKHKLIFEQEKPSSQDDVSVDNFNHTIMLDTTEYRERRAKSFLDTALGENKKRLSGSLLFLTGEKKKVEISKKVTKIGKDPDSDILVKGFMVGKTAAAIEEMASGYHLSYVGGMIKPKVNGKTVKSSILLKNLDIISIGQTKIQFTQTLPISPP